jgi:hypothetical protein
MFRKGSIVMSQTDFDGERDYFDDEQIPSFKRRSVTNDPKYNKKTERMTFRKHKKRCLMYPEDQFK